MKLAILGAGVLEYIGSSLAKAGHTVVFGVRVNASKVQTCSQKSARTLKLQPWLRQQARGCPDRDMGCHA